MAAFAAGQFPGQMLDRQFQLQHERGSRAGGAEELLQGGVEAEEVAVVEVVVVGAGDGGERGLGGAVAGEGAVPISDHE